jgi:pyruvate/2-oxoglutarate dehydrogenase complex dihydrolipoamide acyltransferase (E2) component
MAEVAIPRGLWDVAKTPEGILANWFYADGSAVSAGATIAEIMVEKTTFEITAPQSGQLHITVPKDGVVRPGTVVARVDAA